MQKINGQLVNTIYAFCGPTNGNFCQILQWQGHNHRRRGANLNVQVPHLWFSILTTERIFQKPSTVNSGYCLRHSCTTLATTEVYKCWTTHLDAPCSHVTVPRDSDDQSSSRRRDSGHDVVMWDWRHDRATSTTVFARVYTRVESVSGERLISVIVRL